MSLVFFLYAIWFAFTAWNLWRPVSSPPALAGLSMFLQLLGAILPLQVIVHGLLGWAFYAVGAMDGLLGGLGAVLYVGAFVSVVVFHVRAYSAGDAVERALTEGLGQNYREDVDADLRTAFPPGLSLARIAKPLPQDLPGVEVLKDLPYTGDNDIRALDIYRRVEHGAGRPVLLQIHGGAWTEKMGSKNEQARPLMNHMALRDWICVSVGYRLSPRATLPEHVIDVKRALLWVKDHIAAYGGDPDFVIATGGSAGGHLCALLALSAGDPLFQPHALDRDTSVQGCIPFYGAVDLLNDTGFHRASFQDFLARSVIKATAAENPDLWQSLSPMRRIHADAPPFFVICGDADNLVPVQTNAAFAERLAAVSQEPVCFAQIPNAGHAFDMLRTPHSEHVVHGIERWLAWQYTRYRATQAAPAPTAATGSSYANVDALSQAHDA